MPTSTPNVTYKHCNDESADNTTVVSTCSDYDTDSNTVITEPTSDSNTDEEDVIKVLPIEPFDCKTGNQYAELANFAEDDEDENYIWGHRYVTISKTVMLTSTQTDAWEKLATANNKLDDRHNELMTDTYKLVKAVQYAIFDSGLTGNFLIEVAPVENYYIQSQSHYRVVRQ